MSKRSLLRLIWLTCALAVASCLPRQEDVGSEHSSHKQYLEKQAKAKKKTSKKTKQKGAIASKSTKNKRTAAKHSDRGGADAVPDAVLSEVFQDNFDRPLLGKNWRVTNTRWRIKDGQLCGEKTHNRPSWLKRRLPVNATIEFDATSASTDGDIKVEAWGDGRSGATGVSYTDATSYLAIFGGWKNHLHVLARLDEHASDRKKLSIVPDSDELRRKAVVKDKTYRMRLERRDGRTVIWQVDGEEILRYKDSKPLIGPGHEHFGFNDWEVPVCFDNLKITPL